MKQFDISIASDHAGYKLKSKIINFLATKYKHLQIHDFGTDNDDSVDYPDYAKPVCDSILERSSEKAILICSTGIGMAIAANRNSDIRAALCFNEFMTEKSRQHNDANILVLGSKIIDDELSLRLVEIFLKTEFEGGKHSRRISKIN